jgi:hypothetical protein
MDRTSAKRLIAAIADRSQGIDSSAPRVHVPSMGIVTSWMPRSGAWIERVVVTWTDPATGIVWNYTFQHIVAKKRPIGADTDGCVLAATIVDEIYAEMCAVVE